jgi:hypothetical protein
MSRRRTLGLGALILLGAMPGWTPAAAQINLPPPLADLRVEWDLGRDRKGNAILSGYVYNARAAASAAGVQLRITGTDRTGRVVVNLTAEVRGDVPAGGRSYFEVRVPTWDLAFHVNVVAADFRGHGGA